jgi:hypothetical protein
LTTQARKVLEDCKFAFNELVEALEGGEGRKARKEWVKALKDPDSQLSRKRRVRWVAVMSLLRAVGHTLKNVDAKSSDTGVRKVIDQAWSQLSASKPQPEIFWGFIHAERNAVLKEYEFSVGKADILVEKTVDVQLWDGRTITLPREVRASYPIISGCFAGQEQINVVANAIRFWENYLDQIDRNVQ